MYNGFNRLLHIKWVSPFDLPEMIVGYNQETTCTGHQITIVTKLLLHVLVAIMYYIAGYFQVIFEKVYHKLAYYSFSRGKFHESSIVLSDNICL